MFKEPDRDELKCTWQTKFVDMLPEIKRRLQRAFRHLDPASREESIEEGVVHCLLSFARLHDQGRAESATGSTLAWYAILAVRRGRPTGSRMNGKEPLSRYAQVRHGFEVEQGYGNWIDLLVEDQRASVPDQVAARMDVRAWLATLSRRTQQIARDLALGSSTSEVAAKLGVTAGRISQLRRTLEKSWAAFQGEALAAKA